MPSESALSVKDANGRQISLLNHHSPSLEPLGNTHAHPSRFRQDGVVPTHSTSPRTPLRKSLSPDGRRKYHCTEAGCNKSFTTSGHLARHHRIHTGEKNFRCRYAGCPSRFSRQDNMMQHYRTHLSPRSRRSRPVDKRHVYTPRPERPDPAVLDPPPLRSPVSCPPVVLPQLARSVPPAPLPKLAPLEPQEHDWLTSKTDPTKPWETTTSTSTTTDRPM